MSSDGISLYIHIPFCKSKCIYCDFFSRPGCELYFEDYVDALCKEIKFYSFGLSNSVLNTLYIGGGTPSLLSVELLQKVFTCIKNNFQFNKNFEATIELNPDDVSEKLISFLDSSIINRISIGIQSLKNSTLKLIERRADRDTSLSALKIISKNFSKRLSVDLIAGLPYETSDDLKTNIDELLTFNPEHFSLYSLCIEEGTKLYRLIEENKIDYNSETSDEVYLSAKKYLEEKGFAQYEISNYSKDENSQSRHNKVYWHLENYLGCGSGATGTIFYQNENSIRWTNTNDIEKYISFWKNFTVTDEIKKINFCKEKNISVIRNAFEKIPLETEIIDKETEEFEFFMMNFRLSEGVSKNRYEKRFKKQIEEVNVIKNKTFEKWVNEKKAEMIKTDDDVYYVLNENGRLFLNSFLEEL